MAVRRKHHDFLVPATLQKLRDLLRASLPRPRFDQVMSFGWKVCLPLTLLNMLVTGAVVLLNM